MAFLYHTEVVWVYPVPDNVVQAINQMIESLVQQGKTDGILTVQGDQRIRQWSNLEAAEEWRDFLNSLDPAPVSIDIKPNS
jgi:hypothetical protein